ncbi:MAG: L,D-transpeptidase [Chloroflexi bacterium]|nr:L,D-transpeptidase [Chloroflexota bacterium]
MSGGTPQNGYDLPGVPWVSYFAGNGAALHGTYWHNDFGTPKSAGCINLRPQDARWLFRWTLPEDRRRIAGRVREPRSACRAYCRRSFRRAGKR